MWQVYSDLCESFYLSESIYSHEVCLQKGRNSKLKILGLCVRDFN